MAGGTRPKLTVAQAQALTEANAVVRASLCVP